MYTSAQCTVEKSTRTLGVMSAGNGKKSLTAQYFIEKTLVFKSPTNTTSATHCFVY